MGNGQEYPAAKAVGYKLFNADQNPEPARNAATLNLAKTRFKSLEQIEREQAD